ncbi:unnamed protein product [Discosporangium mesarthrocarpum]
MQLKKEDAKERDMGVMGRPPFNTDKAEGPTSPRMSTRTLTFKKSPPPPPRHAELTGSNKNMANVDNQLLMDREANDKPEKERAGKLGGDGSRPDSYGFGREKRGLERQGNSGTEGGMPSSEKERGPDTVQAQPQSTLHEGPEHNLGLGLAQAWQRSEEEEGVGGTRRGYLHQDGEHEHSPGEYVGGGEMGVGERLDLEHGEVNQSESSVQARTHVEGSTISEGEGSRDEAEEYLKDWEDGGVDMEHSHGTPAEDNLEGHDVKGQQHQGKDAGEGLRLGVEAADTGVAHGSANSSDQDQKEGIADQQDQFQDTDQDQYQGIAEQPSPEKEEEEEEEEEDQGAITQGEEEEDDGDGYYTSDYKDDSDFDDEGFENEKSGEGEGDLGNNHNQTDDRDHAIEVSNASMDIEKDTFPHPGHPSGRLPSSGRRPSVEHLENGSYSRDRCDRDIELGFCYEQEGRILDDACVGEDVSDGPGHMAGHVEDQAPVDMHHATHASSIDGGLDVSSEASVSVIPGLSQGLGQLGFTHIENVEPTEAVGHLNHQPPRMDSLEMRGFTVVEEAEEAESGLKIQPRDQSQRDTLGGRGFNHVEDIEPVGSQKTLSNTSRVGRSLGLSMGGWSKGTADKFLVSSGGVQSGGSSDRHHEEAVELNQTDRMSPIPTLTLTNNAKSRQGLQALDCDLVEDVEPPVHTTDSSLSVASLGSVLG